ncbi:MAG TPA: response regulator, partial [Spirochaetota bacterium]|nr:response regulator [Spirochaetota bacterium]
MNHNAFKTVLLVEDEAVTSAIESRMLEKHGYTVLSADTGERAVEMALNNQDIDVILMDIDLGTGIDGTQAAENILRLKNIPILFLSSHTEQAIVDKTEKITSFGYVVKNSGETVLMASIRMAFRLYDANLVNESKSIELQSTNEQLEATNEELQASMEELIRTNDELEKLLIKHNLSEKALRDSEKEFRSMFDASPA